MDKATAEIIPDLPCPTCGHPMRWLRIETATVECVGPEKHRKRVKETEPGKIAFRKKPGPKNKRSKSARVSARVYPDTLEKLYLAGYTQQKIFDAGMMACLAEIVV